VEKPCYICGRTKGDGCTCVQSYYPSYIVDFIDKLPEKKRLPAKRQLAACATWKRELFADGMAALRGIADLKEDSIMLGIGMPKKHLPKRRHPKTKWVQFNLLTEPNFVQSHAVESAQSADSASYKPDSDFVDARANSSKTDTTTTTTEQPPAPPVVQERVVVAERLEISNAAAERLLSECRYGHPGCTVEYVLEVADEVKRSLGRSVKNPPGIIVTETPRLIASRHAKRQAEALAVAERQEHERQHAAAVSAQRERAAAALDADTPWAAICRFQRQHLTEASYNNWFAATEHLTLDDGVLQVSVPDHPTKQWLSTEYAPLVEQTIRALALPIKRVQYVVVERSGAGGAS
jgi:hypothetical protein